MVGKLYKFSCYAVCKGDLFWRKICLGCLLAVVDDGVFPGIKAVGVGYCFGGLNG